MKKLAAFFASLLVATAIASTPASAAQFTFDSMTVSNVCSDSQGNRYQYTGFFGKVGTPCTWLIGDHQYTGVFGG